MGYTGCAHLDSQKSEEDGFVQIFETLHSIFVVNGSKDRRRIRNASAYCYVCGTRTISSGLHVCLHCTYFGCRQHIREHNKIKKHLFALDLGFGQVHCSMCGDYVYDKQLDQIARANVLLGDTVKTEILDLIWPQEGSEGDKWFVKAERFAVTRSTQDGLRGLLNLGATCFMNSVVQVLTHTPVLRDYFFTEDHSCTQSPDKCLITNLFRDFYAGDKIPLILSEFLQLIWTQAPHLAGHKQQDAHEFFIACLDVFHNHCKSTEIAGSKRRHCNCIVHQVFSGSLQSDLVCQKCKDISSTVDPSVDYALDLAPEGLSSPKTLEDCLRRYTGVETVNFMCKNCQTLKTKQFSLKVLPIVICFQLKRFETSQVLNRKVSTKVRYPEVLDVTPFMTKSSEENKSETPAMPHDNTYILFAVVSHVGESLEAGHYISYIRYDDKIWFRCNDLIISEAGIEQVLASEGYLLFYHKKMLKYK